MTESSIIVTDIAGLLYLVIYAQLFGGIGYFLGIRRCKKSADSSSTPGDSDE